MSIWSAIGTAAGYYLGGPAGAAIGASVGGGMDANAASAASAQNAMDFSASQYANRYQTTVKDLEAAGLSPMLAYSQGAGSSPTGVSYTAQNIAAGVPSAYASTANLDVQRTQGMSSAYESLSKGDLNYHQSQLVDETVKKVTAEVANIESDTKKNGFASEVLRQQYQNLVAERANLTDQGNVLRATVDKLKAEIPAITNRGLLDAANTTLANLDAEAAKSSGNLGRRAGEYKDFVNMLVSVLRGRK